VVQEGAERTLARLREPLSVHGSEREPADHDLRRERGDRRQSPSERLRQKTTLDVTRPLGRTHVSWVARDSNPEPTD
jgi:hypothetical protein